MNARTDGLPKQSTGRWQYGITLRDRAKPWLVKFRRNKKTINVGSYSRYDDAKIAAEEFLRKERK